MILLQTLDDIVCHKEEFLLESIHRLTDKSFVSIAKELSCLIDDQFITQVIFVFKI